MIHEDYDTYTKEHRDVAGWLQGYVPNAVKIFEPLWRDLIALAQNAEMAKLLRS